MYAESSVCESCVVRDISEKTHFFPPGRIVKRPEILWAATGGVMTTGLRIDGSVDEQLACKGGKEGIGKGYAVVDARRKLRVRVMRCSGYKREDALSFSQLYSEKDLRFYERRRQGGRAGGSGRRQTA
jgi:hypothetical protein